MGRFPPAILVTPESYGLSPRLISAPEVKNLSSTMTVVDPRVSSLLSNPRAASEC